MSVTIDLSQPLALGNGFIGGMRPGRTVRRRLAVWLSDAGQLSKGAGQVDLGIAFEQMELYELLHGHDSDADVPVFPTFGRGVGRRDDQSGERGSHLMAGTGRGVAHDLLAAMANSRLLLWPSLRLAPVPGVCCLESTLAMSSAVSV